MRLIATIAAAVCAVAAHAASLAWLPGFGDAAKGAYRGARNAVEEVGDIVLSAPQERILEGCTFSEKETVLFLHDAMKLNATVKGVANWSSVSAEDMERWVYWAGTVLGGNEVVDDDPEDYPCQCGISVNLETFGA